MARGSRALHARVTKRIFVVLVALGAIAGRAVATAGQAATAPTPLVGCSGPEYRQFDFWVGDWDAFAAGSATPSARVRVTRILDGCAIREDYQDVRGLVGDSVSTYDPARQLWQQSWVTNRGQLLLLDGAFAHGAMVLTGPDRAAGTAALARGTWTRTEDGVREIGVTSADGGKTWRPWFDLMFRPHEP
jgi:hypothetical protein